MNFQEKPTKAEYLLLLMAAVFLSGLAVAALGAQGQTGTVVTVQRQPDVDSTLARDTVAAAADGEPVNLNTATAQELEALSGIGPVLAQRIIDYREQYGPFESIDELIEVKGIGPVLLEKLRGFVSVDMDGA